ncbi:MAG: protein-disulfide reductase DsbD domain-containing protein [Acidiferrobacterales bacterium]
MARFARSAPALLTGLLLSLTSPIQGGMQGNTADRVKFSVQLSDSTLSPGRALDVALTLRIDKGWHVIANPPSLDFLIPITAEAVLDQGSLEFTSRYPEAERKLDLGLDKAIGVYENGAVSRSTLAPVRLPLGRTEGQIVFSLRAQACSDTGVCLRPATIRIDVPVHFADRPDKPE